MVEFHRLKIIQIKESRWIIAISSNGSLYYTYMIRTCTYILHMLVKTSEISAWRAFTIPFLFDLQHISLKISASVLMIWDQTEDTGLSFRKNTAFCLAQNGTKIRPAKIRSALKLASSKSSASQRCRWTATKVAFFDALRWMIPNTTCVPATKSTEMISSDHKISQKVSQVSLGDSNLVVVF